MVCYGDDVAKSMEATPRGDISAGKPGARSAWPEQEARLRKPSWRGRGEEVRSEGLEAACEAEAVPSDRKDAWGEKCLFSLAPQPTPEGWL